MVRDSRLSFQCIATDIHVLRTIFNTRVGEIRVQCTATNISGLLSRLKKKKRLKCFRTVGGFASHLTNMFYAVRRNCAGEFEGTASWRIFFRSHITLHFILLNASKVKRAHVQIWQVKPLSPPYYSVTKTLRWKQRIVCYFHQSVDCLAGKGIGSVVTGQVRMPECVLHTCVNLWYHKNKMVPIILVALVAHHRPTITSCSGGLMWDILQTSNCFSEG